MSQEPGFGTDGGPATPPPPPGGQPPAPPSGPVGGWQAPGLPPSGGPTGAWGAPSPAAPASWEAPHANAGNGCLKACLIVGGILVVLAILVVAGLVVVGGRLVDQISEDPEAFFGGPCQYTSDVELSSAVGEDVTAMTLEGFADGTMGALLDKRLLPDAPDCWVVGEDGFAARIAVDDGGGAQAFTDALARADAGGFRSDGAPGVGDQAFCTTMSEMGSSGALVRFGERVVYASVVQDNPLVAGTACDVATRMAGTLQP